MSMVHSSIALEVIAMDWPVHRMKATGYYLAQCAQNKTFSKLNTKLMAIYMHVIVAIIICTHIYIYQFIIYVNY